MRKICGMTFAVALRERAGKVLVDNRGVQYVVGSYDNPEELFAMDPSPPKKFLIRLSDGKMFCVRSSAANVALYFRM